MMWFFNFIIRQPAAIALGLGVALVFSLAPSVSAGSLPETIRLIKPSIVGIGTYHPTNRPQSRVLGTGFVISPGNLIVTNHHVVDRLLDTERKEKLVAFAGNGKRGQLLDLKLLAKSERYDLAVLAIPKKLPAMNLASSGMRAEGESIAFTGFPMGAVLGLYPVTHRGIISSITPIAIPAPSSSQLNASKINALRNPTTVYQLDATAYPGNSGSPVFDAQTGRVVGIVNMVHVKTTKEDILSKPSGVTYAIPVRYLHELLKTIR